MKIVKGNKLYIGNISAQELIDKHGSPLYVYDETIIRERYRALFSAIMYPKKRIYFAMKANSNPEVLMVLLKEGAYIDAVSPGEVHVALKVGFPPERILFTGNNVTDKEMEYIVGKDVLVNCDSLSQLERYGKMNPDTNVAVRINPDVGAGHHDHVITGGPLSKFGIYPDRIQEVLDIAEKHRLKIIGLHQHIGSGILEADRFIQSIKVILEEACKFPDLEFVDFGGGIGVAYKPDQKPIDISELGRKISDTFETFCRSVGKDLALAIEPGRFFVCESGWLLATVNTIKRRKDGRVFVGCDTGFNHLVRPAMYGSYHEIINASNVEGDAEKVDVCGNICESGDLFARDRKITKFKEGDIVAIANAGAYGFSMASRYNSRPLPAEVMVLANDSRVIRRRETFEDIL